MKFQLPPNYNSLAGALVSLFGTSVAIAEADLAMTELFGPTYLGPVLSIVAEYVG